MDIKWRIWRWKKLCRGFIFVYLIVLVGIVFLFHRQSNQIIFEVTSALRPTQVLTKRLVPKILPTHTTSNNSKLSNAWIPFIKYELNKDDKTFKHWLDKEESICDGKFAGYNSLFARLHNVTLDPSKGQGRKGGENISDVFNQPEEAEYFKLEKGYFLLDCKDAIKYPFKEKDHLRKWFNAIDTNPERIGKDIRSRWIIAVMRYEYANLYHTMTDYYNAYLMTVKFNLEPSQTDILFVDGHPVGALDGTWNTLFGNIWRAGQIEQPVLYRNMVWNILGYYSPLNEHNAPVIPLVENFRQFFLSRHDIHEEKSLACDKLTVVFLWRRDYLAHPRNPTGKVSRKVKNEVELISGVRDLLPGHDVRGIQIDKLSMKSQLQLISETDILIGMHGAGLSHTLFLPPHAGLIELYPNYWPTANRHFRAMAQWRHLHYSVWANTKASRELSNKYTIVDKDAVVKMVHETHHKMCGGQADDKIT